MIPFKQIRVGPYDVQIVPLAGEDREKCLGIFYKVDMRIGMLEKYPSEQREAETFLHEVMHSIYEVMGIRAKDSEERTVTQMSLGWAMVIRDNPRLIAWLSKKLR